MDIADLIKRCIRLLHIARKPTDAEFSQVAKVTAFGMFLFGLVGFIISYLFRLIR